MVRIDATFECPICAAYGHPTPLGGAVALKGHISQHTELPRSDRLRAESKALEDAEKKDQRPKED
jgi:hypothetical protein